jgi:hypothetical protein
LLFIKPQRIKATAEKKEKKGKEKKCGIEMRSLM